MNKRNAIVAGASGLIGRRIAEQLLADGGWHVTGLARRAQSRLSLRYFALHPGHDLFRDVAWNFFVP